MGALVCAQMRKVAGRVKKSEEELGSGLEVRLYFFGTVRFVRVYALFCPVCVVKHHGTKAKDSQGC